MMSARWLGTLSVWVTSCVEQVLATALVEGDRTPSGCRAGLVLDPAGCDERVAGCVSRAICRSRM